MAARAPRSHIDYFTLLLLRARWRRAWHSQPTRPATTASKFRLRRVWIREWPNNCAKQTQRRWFACDLLIRLIVARAPPDYAVYCCRWCDFNSLRLLVFTYVIGWWCQRIFYFGSRCPGTWSWKWCYHNDSEKSCKSSLIHHSFIHSAHTQHKKRGLLWHLSIETLMTACPACMIHQCLLRHVRGVRDVHANHLIAWCNNVNNLQLNETNVIHLELCVNGWSSIQSSTARPWRMSNGCVCLAGTKRSLITWVPMATWTRWRRSRRRPICPETSSASSPASWRRSGRRCCGCRRRWWIWSRSSAKLRRSSSMARPRAASATPASGFHVRRKNTASLVKTTEKNTNFYLFRVHSFLNPKSYLPIL